MKARNEPVMATRRAKLSKALREMEKLKKEALRDRRRLFYLAISNVVLTVIVAIGGYLFAGPTVSLVALGLGALKDGSLIAGTYKQVESYMRDKGFLNASLVEIRTFCTMVDEDDEEMFVQAKTMIFGFFEDLKLSYGRPGVGKGHA